MSEELVCPDCGRGHPRSERFCRECGMPLVHADQGSEEPVTEAQRKARKIRPQYSRGELVRVAGGRNQAEAELVQGILLEEGIPSIQRRTRGFDVPDFLAAGPRDILVPESGYEAARELLAANDLGEQQPAAGEMPGIGSPQRLAAWVLAAAALGTLLVWVLYEISS